MRLDIGDYCKYGSVTESAAESRSLSTVTAELVRSP